MARRNLLRSWLAASLLALTGAAGAMAAVAVPASPAGAVDNNYVDVTVLETAFNPATVYARPGDIVRFTLGTGVSTQHTVTLEAGSCNGRPNQLCERTFDDTHRTVMFRFSSSDTYPYFDRIARDAGNNDMRGTIVITDQPPVTSNTTPPTTAPRATTTTTAAPTATTEPGSIHPFLVNDPPQESTTTTTAPAHLSVVTIPAPPAKTGTGAAAAADSGKGKAKAAPGSTTTTTAPAAAVPDPSILVPASLLPTPDSPPPAVSSDSNTPVDDVTSAAADLLHNDGSDDGTHLLLIIAIAALTVFLLGAGTIGWYRRSSRYFPA